MRELTGNIDSSKCWTLNERRQNKAHDSREHGSIADHHGLRKQIEEAEDFCQFGSVISDNSS